jgi:hypothetical protein
MFAPQADFLSHVAQDKKFVLARDRLACAGELLAVAKIEVLKN